MSVRINKYLSLCGIGSRRKIEELLKAGEFKVDGKTAEPGMLVDEHNKVMWNGMVLAPRRDFVYYALNKPAGYVSTVSDEEGRQTVLDLVPTSERLYPVGRLDKNSTGLILLTNDGDFALKLTHPRYHLPKIYEVKTHEKISDTQLAQLSKGVRVQGKKTLPAEITRHDDNFFEITLHQGMKRQIREMCTYVGLNVKSLHRIAVGSIKIGDLKPGKFRELTSKEIKDLYETP